MSLGSEGEVASTNTPRAIVIFLASTLTVMSAVMVAPALPKMQDAFQGVENAELLVPLSLTVPALFLGLFAPMAGWIVDRFGRRRLLVISCAVYSVVGVFPYFLDSLPEILAARALLGIAEGAVFTVTTTLVADYYEGAKRTRILGLQSAFMAGGGVVSVIAGGVLGDISWRHPYLVYGWPILLVPFVLAFVNEPQVKRLEKSASSPATTFPYGPVALVYAVTFAGMLAFYCMPVQTPYIFKAIGEDRPSIAGLGGATGVSSSIIAALMLPLIARLIGNARLLGLTFSLLATGLVVVGLAETVQQIIAGMLIAGLGGGLLVPNVALWLNGIVDETVRGRANGGLSSAIFFSQFANPLIFLPLASATGGLGNALVVLGGLIALVAIIAIFSSRGKRAEEAAPARALV